MEFDSTHPIISTLRNKIVEEYAPEKIILFGSYANGNASQESDVDLIIIKNGEENHFEKNRAVSKILRRSGVPLDILVYSQAEWETRSAIPLNFEHHIANHSIVLYDRTTP